MPTFVPRVGLFAIIALAVVVSAGGAELRSDTTTVQRFPLAQVRLLDGPFRHAQELDRRYLLALEVDRLLGPFRIEAGLEPKASKYPNWESSGLEGHTAGHYLTALAEMWADTGDAELKRRLDYMVSELDACQRASGDGYVGGVPHSRKLWSEVAAARLNFQNFSLNDAWVPWYNEHKLFAGLRDAWLIGKNPEARDVLVRLADWCGAVVAKLSDAQMQDMLRTEHGGMNEVLADVFAITGDTKYLALAQRFTHRAILEPLLRHEDKLTGLHANTQIPKAVGFVRIAELGGDAAWRDAARFFWETVSTHRTLAFGGNSESEHFNPTDNFSSLLESRQGPETCNTYNMLRLTEALFAGEPVARYVDFYERALFNHILSSQHPEHGGFVYFTPIRPQHYRVYSQPGECFWCCVGTGMENHARHGDFIYAHTGDALFVNLFIASEVDWPERRLRLTQETTFPDAPRSRLIVHAERPQRFTMTVRHPGWVTREEFAVRVNGVALAEKSDPASFVGITREWREGDRVEIELPMHTKLERLPDGSDYAAVLHGPIVLAARTGTERLDRLIADNSRMGHVSPGPYLPLDEAPMLVGDVAQFAARIQPVPGKTLTFSARGVIQPEKFRDVELTPFFRIHDARYVMYWRMASPEKYGEVTAALAATEKARLELEARTLDQVTPGEQQPEVEHILKSDGSNSGANQGRRWRDATGWFSYELKAPPAGAPVQLLVTYYADERGRSFDILVNDRPIAAVTLNGRQRDRFVDVAYAIPSDAVAASAGDRMIVKFVAAEKSRTGSIYGVRLVKQAGR